jgi:hypothetical protein
MVAVACPGPITMVGFIVIGAWTLWGALRGG